MVSINFYHDQLAHAIIRKTLTIIVGEINDIRELHKLTQQNRKMYFAYDITMQKVCKVV